MGISGSFNIHEIVLLHGRFFIVEKVLRVSLGLKKGLYYSFFFFFLQIKALKGRKSEQNSLSF